jgi:AcrR family transcriptional regulator
LRSVFALISEKGIDGVTITDVAKRSGVHETSIYRRWETPKALILAACMRFIGDAVPTPNTGSLRADLISMMRGAVALHKSPQGQVILALNRLGSDKAQQAKHDFWQERFKRLQPMFDRAVARGEFPKDVDPIHLLETLIAPLHFRLLVSAETIDDWPVVKMVERVLQGYESRQRRRLG